MKKRIMIVSCILITIALGISCFVLFRGDSDKSDKEKEKGKSTSAPIGNNAPKDIWGRVEEIPQDGIVNIRVIKSECKLGKDDLLQIEYDTVSVLEVNTGVEVNKGDVVIATIWNDNEIKKEDDQYALKTEEIKWCYEGGIAYGYVEKCVGDGTIDVIIEGVDIYDNAEYSTMKELVDKKVKVNYETFEANWSKEGYIPEASTPKEGLEVRILFEKESVVDDGDDIVINCERIFEIKPYDYFQTTAKEE